MVQRTMFGFAQVLAGFLLTLAAAFSANAQDTLKGVALVIGQSKYEHITPLTNPAQDARDIAKLLTDLGFDARSVSDRDASKLSRDLERFVEDAEGTDVAILYYAGHGIEASGENWLVPVDADASSLLDAREKLVPVGEILKQLQAAVPITVVLLDACRTNPFPADAVLKITPSGSGNTVSAGGLSIVRGAVSMTANKPANDNLGVVIGFAAEPGKPALDGAIGENSPYAAALIRHLTAMKGAEFGQVMRMVTEEVYLDTKAQQRPWVNESLRRFLYFGVAPDEPTGVEGQINGERRQLLLTIADLPDVQRAQVETVALQDAVPLDALYGVLRAMGEERTPQNPGEMAKALEEQAGRLKKLLSDRDALRTDDPQTQTLLASADQAINEGAIQTARSFLDQAVHRVEATQGTVDEAEEIIKNKRIADAAIYARRAEASVLVFEYASAAADYAKAFELIEKWDEKLRWNYKNLQAEALGKLGYAKGDRKALDDAVSAYQQVLDMIPRGDQGRDFAITNNNLATVLETIGNRETGTETLERAVSLYRDSLAFFDKSADPKDDVNWAAAQNNIGNVLITIGERKGDNAILDQAVDAHRAALARRDRTKNSYDWASSQNNLGLALYLVAEKKGGGKFYDEAEAAYRKALEEWTRTKYPAEWAMTLNNLSNTLNAQGNERAEPAKFREAAANYRQALEVRTREIFPVAWGNTQINLGVALTYAAKFSTGTDDVNGAIEAFTSALEVFPRETLPLEWASVQTNLGSALQLLGQRTMAAEPVERSVAQYSEARKVYTRENFPMDWAMTHYNSGNSLKLLAGLTQQPERYREAADAYQESLKEYTRERVPEQWAITQANLGSALQFVGSPDSLRESIEARRAALEVLTLENSRLDWASAQSGLGMSLNNLGLFEQTNKYAGEAETAFIESLKVYTEESDPIQWAFGKNNIGDVYWNRGTIGKDKKSLEKALEYFAEARAGFERAGGQMMIPLVDSKVDVVKKAIAAL